MSNWLLNHKEFLETFDRGEEISERCLLQYAYGGEETYRGDDRRWTRTIESVCEIGGRYFKFCWEQGLTENQPDACYDNPVEVRKVEYDKVIPEHTVHIVEWNEV